MEKLRDLLYNISDILVTLIIIIAALLLISWRVSAIMHYGSSDAPASDTEIIAEAELSADADSAGASENTDASDTSDSDGNGDNSDSDAAAPAADTSFTISSSQTADSIGQALADAGLISDKQAFIDAVNSADAATRLKAGTFTIPAGSTPEQIVVIFTS